MMPLFWFFGFLPLRCVTSSKGQTDDSQCRAWANPLIPVTTWPSSNSWVLNMCGLRLRSSFITPLGFMFFSPLPIISETFKLKATCVLFVSPLQNQTRKVTNSGREFPQTQDFASVIHCSSDCSGLFRGGAWWWKLVTEKILTSREQERKKRLEVPTATPHPAGTLPMALRYKTLSSKPEHQSMAELTSRD